MQWVVCCRLRHANLPACPLLLANQLLTFWFPASSPCRLRHGDLQHAAAAADCQGEAGCACGAEGCAGNHSRLHRPRLLSRRNDNAVGCKATAKPRVVEDPACLLQQAITSTPTPLPPAPYLLSATGHEDHTHYHEFSDLEQSVRDDVKLLRDSPL